MNHTYAPMLYTDALPSICASPKCLNSAGTFSAYCNACGEPESIRLRSYSDEIWIYFIRSADGPIRIAATNDVERRFKELQKATPTKLSLLLAVQGRPALETELQAMLADSNIQGKWFRPSQAVSTVIQTASSDGTKGLYALIRERCYSI